MTERPAAAADSDDIELHPDYLPEPDFFDEDDDLGPEDQAPDPAEDDDGG